MSTLAASNPINFKEVYFNHTSLTIVTVNPTYTDLQSMYNKIKANSASVPSTLGGGNHSHLCLVTDAMTYKRIVLANEYVRPVQPAPLGANNTGTVAQIAENIFRHNIAITNFSEAKHIKHTIIKQIQSALAESVIITKSMRK